ncbi:hypothetical protein LguiB_018185 [Lonicera macranthoides]
MLLASSTNFGSFTSSPNKVMKSSSSSSYSPSNIQLPIMFTPLTSSSWGCLLVSNTLSSAVIFPKLIFISPFLQLISALAVARNGRPRITGICPFVF